MLADFLLGAKYAVDGMRLFRKRRGYWGEAAVPLLLLLLIYLVLAGLGAWGAIYCTHLISDWSASWPDWLQWGRSFLRWTAAIVWPILFLLFVGATVSIGYEMIGGVMFDSLAAHFEEREYHIPPFRRTSGYWWAFITDSCIYACNTAVLTVILFIVALCLPIIGPVMQFCILGYRYGVSNLSNVIFNRGLRFRPLKKMSRRRRILVLGYGVTCYALMLVPFVSILFFPGLILGGVMLYDYELEKRPDLPAKKLQSMETVAALHE